MVQTTRLFPRSMGRWLMALMLVMLSSLATRAAEAYACYTPSNTTLTFYYDNLRATRPGTTYDLNTDYTDTDWETDGTNANVTRVVFDSSFANARPTITYAWFYGMGNLQSITGISYLNTSEVTNMAWMFGQCENLTSLDLSGFNTANVTDMRGMFTRCNKLTTIYASSSWSTAAVTDSYNMFNDCTSLVGGMGTTYNSSHVDKAYAHIDGGTSNPGYFTRDPNSPEAYACYTPSNTTLTFYYDNLRSSRTGTTYDLNTGSNITGWETSGTNANVTKVVFNSSFANARPTTTYSWFYGMGNLQSITGMKEYLKTSAVTNMAWMFSESTKLTTIDLSGFNTAKVTDMRGMFSSCNMLTTIYVGSGWSTAAVTYSNSMFENCTSLVGGQGTTYNANHTDKAYAHIDGGTSNPGYFTDVAPVAYACYTPSNRTLTFYYDNQRSLRTGTTYDLNTGYRIPDWFNDGSYYNVLKVVFATSFAGARPTSTAYWFYCMEELQSITGLNYLNTSEVTNMACMFENCKKLTSIDLSSFNTDNVTTMEYMFHECSSLTSLDLSSFDTSKATSMGDMFSGCTSLTSLDLSSFNTSNVKYMDSMFEYNSNLRTIYVGNGWSTAAVTGSLLMFHDCTSLVGGKGTTYSSSHTDKAYAHIDGGPSNPGYFSEFKEAYACYTPENTTLTFYYDNQRSSRPGTTYDLNTEQNLPGWHYKDITKVVFNPSFADARPTTTYRWFDGFTKLTTITGRNYLNTSEVTDMSDMFKACCALTSLDVSHFDTQKVTNMSGMFYGCSSLTSLNVSNFNTSNVTKMGSMFGDCSGLTSLNVSSFNTSKVTWMSGIFAGCSGLTSLNLSNFNTANVTSMLNMFAYCSSLTSLNVSSFNTSNVTEMGFMFQECSSLTSLNVSSFNTSNVTYMGYMFSGCTRLTSLDLSSFNTSKATYMGEMFYGCSSLTSLDLSSFNTSKVTNMGYMFQDCSSLQTVYVDSSWSTAAVTGSYNMFTNCTNLVGGMGTTYDSSHTDKAYAHIDGGPSNPGYLTEKPAFVRGDVNGDGQVKINDVTALINFLLSHNGTGINLHAADANQSGGITISDVTALINFLLSGRWP